MWAEGTLFTCFCQSRQTSLLWQTCAHSTPPETPSLKIYLEQLRSISNKITAPGSQSTADRFYFVRDVRFASDTSTRFAALSSDK